MSDQAIAFGPFRLIPSQRLLLKGGTEVHVGHRALTILQILVERAGKVVDKRELARLVWPDAVVEEANIRVHVRTLRRVLEDGQDGARYIVSIPKRGYSFTGTVSYSTDAVERNGTALPTRPIGHAIPTSITRLFGREEAIVKLKSELGRERMITVVGPAGIGKTQLALAATQSPSTSSYTAYFVDLATVADPSSVPAAVASAVATSTIYEDIVGTMLRELQNRRLLIILDNCEHVIDATASLCQVLLSGTKQLRLLATSREPLRIAGEWVHHVSPLALPPADHPLTAAEALTFPAVQLFIERSVANVDTFKFRDEEADAVANICRRLDGLPLAIEFAAARTDIFDLRTLAAKLDDRFALLTRGRRTALPRQQTLRAALDWSYGLLSSEEQLVLRRLSIFSVSFCVDDAIVVAGDGTFTKEEVVEILSNLLAKSMVTADVGGYVAVYRLLETIHVYSSEKLSDAGEAEELRRRHARRYLERCSRPGATEIDPVPLRQAMIEARAALDWALVREGDVALGVDLAAAATPIALRLSMLREHRKYLALALLHRSSAMRSKSGRKPDLRAEMALHTAVALADYFTEGPSQMVDDYLKVAHKLSQALGDRFHELRILWMLYGIAGNTGSYREAAVYGESYNALTAVSEEPMAKSRSHRHMSRVRSDLGQLDVAQQFAECALQPVRELIPQSRLDAYEIDHWIASRATYARILWLRGYPDDAKAQAEQCLSESLQLGHEQSTCWALAFNLSPVAIWRGDLVEAGRLTKLLLQHSHRVFQHWNEWGRLYERFLTVAAPGAAPGSESWFTDLSPPLPAQTDLLATFDSRLVGPPTLHRAESDEDIWCAPEILRAWTVRRLSSDTLSYSSAQTVLEHSLRIAQRQGARAWQLRSATSLASVLHESGRTDQARELLKSTLDLFTQGQSTKDIRAAFQVLSEL
jgi:predicted ATPase/DNA-binding winged helix-turn-helix (wHTH) protein